MASSAAISDAAPPAAAAPRKGGKGLLMAVLALLLGAGGAGGWFVYQGRIAAAQAAEAEGEGGAAPLHKGPPIYVALEPVFVVNLSDRDAMRFMQVEVQALVRKPEVADQLKQHLPLIRNRLLLLFSAQQFGELNSREAKERLQQQALEEVRKVMQEQTGKPGVDAIYFTSLVMQ